VQGSGGQYADKRKMAARGPPSFRSGSRQIVILLGSWCFCCCGFRRCCCLCGCLFGGQCLSCCNLFSLDASALGNNGLTLCFVELAGAHAGVLDDTSRLTATIAQVVQLGATDLAATDD